MFFLRKTTTTTTTTTTTVAPPTTGPPPCVCGTGAKPSIETIRFLKFDDVHEEELLEKVGPSQRSALEREEQEKDDESFKDLEDDIRIVHGVTSKSNAWPWMASIQYVILH
jgi:hypothetical protein